MWLCSSTASPGPARLLEGAGYRFHTVFTLTQMLDRWERLGQVPAGANCGGARFFAKITWDINHDVPIIRPLLFRLDPEQAHHLTLKLLRLTGAVPILRAAVRGRYAWPESRPVEAFGLTFPNVVGLAAGYDKDGLGWRGLAALGFGHIEVGTVTPQPQAGNPRPRAVPPAGGEGADQPVGFPRIGG